MYHQPRRIKGYSEVLTDTQKKAVKFSEFSNELIAKAAVPHEFSFGTKKYKAPPRTQVESEADEKDKEKPIIRKALEEEQ